MYLSTDHSGLNKKIFGPEDENFLLTLPEIQRMIEMAPRTVRERHDCAPPTLPLAIACSLRSC